MKKYVPLILILSFTVMAGAQVPRYCFIEEFTQASCVPCSQENPGFNTNILTANPQKVRHIAYHTSWPGTDPMYSFNSGGNNARTSFYVVPGVPDAFLLGNMKVAQPNGFTQADVDEAWSSGSPLNLILTETDNGTSKDVTVQINSVGAPPSGNYELYVACIQRNVNYSSPPGGNGEKYFPNVFLSMISGDPQTLPNGNADGVAVTLPPQGSSLTMGPYTYQKSWAINGQTTELAAIAWVQNTATKEILQCGSTFDSPVNGTITAPSPRVLNGPASVQQAFNLVTGNIGTAGETFTYTLSVTQPADWTADFSLNGQNYAATATVTIPAATSYSVQIRVTPGSTPAVGRYTLTMQSQTNPSSPATVTNAYVLSGITDLIVSNSAGLGSGSGTPAQFEPQYIAGLQYASCSSYGTTDDKVLLLALQDTAMGPIKYVYWNVGWSFPAFKNDNLANELKKFLDGGGCLFLSGQDIGWDTWEVAAGASGTAATQSFYTNYLNASYLNDGAATDNQITVNVPDPIFGSTGNFSLSTAAYGSGYFFPDNLKPAGIGQAIYFYNGDTARAAGIRATNGIYKTVYMAPGVEQLGTAAAKNTILKISYDWFHGALSTEDLDNGMLAMCLGQNFPNPGSAHTYIPFENLTSDAILQVMDLQGRILLQHAIRKGTALFNLNTASLETGMYLYRIVGDGKASRARTMEIIR